MTASAARAERARLAREALRGLAEVESEARRLDEAAGELVERGRRLDEVMEAWEGMFEETGVLRGAKPSAKATTRVAAAAAATTTTTEDRDRTPRKRTRDDASSGVMFDDDAE